MNTEEDFAYRPNIDGTFDSICLRCYLTVETGNSIEDLAGQERRHECKDNHLSNLSSKLPNNVPAEEDERHIAPTL